MLSWSQTVYFYTLSKTYRLLFHVLCERTKTRWFGSSIIISTFPFLLIVCQDPRLFQAIYRNNYQGFDLESKQESILISVMAGQHAKIIIIIVKKTYYVKFNEAPRSKWGVTLGHYFLYFCLLLSYTKSIATSSICRSICRYLEKLLWMIVPNGVCGCFFEWFSPGR